MNKVILKGRTVKVPEIRHSQNGEDMCFARFTLAVEDKSWKQEDGKSHVDYISCQVVGKLAELVERSVKKGQELLLCGKWRTDSYKKDEKTIYIQYLFVQELYYCGKKEDSPMNFSNSFMVIPDGLDAELPIN